ncbi:MAG: hypothetical protein QM687_05555 [Ferruginibacter sp.]
MKRPLVPAFLKKFDQYLLLNKPDTWSARVHLLVYYSLLFCAAIGLYAFVTFDDPRLNMQSEVPMIFTFLISFIGLVLWLIFLLRFNVFKRFGEYRFGNGWKTFLLFFTGMFFLVLPNYIPLIVESAKANAKYSTAELVKDANRINEIILMKHKNLVPQVWQTDSFKVLPKTDQRLQDPYSTTATVVTADSIVEYLPIREHYTFITREDMDEKLVMADSVIKLTDSTYEISSCPQFQFVSAHDADSRGSERMLSSRQLYDKIVLGNKKADAAIDKELKELLYKYNNGIISYYYYNDETYSGIIDRQYELYKTNNSISNISEKKYLWDTTHLPIYFRIIFYISFCLGLLLFIFRHSTVKTFFLSILTAILFMIIDGLLITTTGSSEVGIIGMFLFNYLIVFIVMLMAQRYQQNRCRRHCAQPGHRFYSVYSFGMRFLLL